MLPLSHRSTELSSSLTPRLTGRLRRFGTAALALVCFAGPAAAEVPNEALVCPADPIELDPHRYARSLSLDLTGAGPTDVDYQLAEEGELDALIDGFLESEGFVSRMVRRHDALFWPNITNVNLSNARIGLGVTGGIYWSRNRSALYRGDTIECLNEPATWREDGTLETQPYYNAATGKTSQREGYVEVVPYWLPATQSVKVCAFDAQTAATAPSGLTCNSREGLNDAGCGCGPELQWCQGGTANRQVAEAMAEDLHKRVAALIREDRPYLELFTSTRAYVNGPLVHFLRHRAEALTANFRFDPLPIDVSTLPDLHFRDAATWVEIELPPHHAGILTSWAFLARFQTDRARANRFYNAFLCQPFQPPTTGIPIDPTAALEPDLQKRAGCKYCHALLEPSASYWGRWAETSAGYLAPVTHPPFREDCWTCAKLGTACPAVCRSDYVVAAATPTEVPNLGKMTWYAFRRPEHELNIEKGPRLLAYQTIVDGRLPTCVARTTAEWLLGRKLEEGEKPWADQLATDFAADGYRIKSLVRAIVSHATYRRVR
ncbi:MAG: DUF1585 domain-containing protein [Myxococcales bacterium]|nr:DUF1585 domain-containing protein [Myxococcales bacterium]